MLNAAIDVSIFVVHKRDNVYLSNLLDARLLHFEEILRGIKIVNYLLQINRKLLHLRHVVERLTVGALDLLFVT